MTLYKVEIITDIIVNLCVEKKTREIVYGIIDLGKTFAIYTNVDFAEYKFSQNLTKNDSCDAFGSCAFMIEMLLSSWSTLIYFINEKNTLKNFVATLKRKSEKDIKIINEFIFSKIINRVINYSKTKMKKCNNLFAN